MRRARILRGTEWHSVQLPLYQGHHMSQGKRAADDAKPAVTASRWHFSLATLLTAPVAVFVFFAATAHFDDRGVLPVALLLAFSTWFLLAARDWDRRAWWLGFTCALAFHLMIVSDCDKYLGDTGISRDAAARVGVSRHLLEVGIGLFMIAFHFLLAWSLGMLGGTFVQRAFRCIKRPSANPDSSVPRSLVFFVPIICLCWLLPLPIILMNSLPPIRFSDRWELDGPWMGAVAVITAVNSFLIVSMLAVWRIGARWTILCGLAVGITIWALVNATTFWRDGTLSMWFEWSTADVPFLLRCPEVFLGAVCLAVALFVTTATYAVWLAVEPGKPTR
jgi:hypothetical protein